MNVLILMMIGHLIFATHIYKYILININSIIVFNVMRIHLFKFFSPVIIVNEVMFPMNNLLIKNL